ncbi:MAG: hypothetical protein AB7L17_12310, partial [Ilumatobacteraceae bacterium]
MAALLTCTAVTASLAVVDSFSAGAATGLISGTVYRDLDNDGVRDPREPGVAGVVVASGDVRDVTDSNGSWSFTQSGTVKLAVTTGWYRSQCDAVDCPAGAGRDQDFAVVDQMIVSPSVYAPGGPKLDLGLLPDWRGTYPIPKAPVPANSADIAARLEWQQPTGEECARTERVADRACARDDQPRFSVQILNEGTTSIKDPAGYVQLAMGTWIDSIVPNLSAPATNPALTKIVLGAMDMNTKRVPFTVKGTMPPATAAVFTMTVNIGKKTPANP